LPRRFVQLTELLLQQAAYLVQILESCAKPELDRYLHQLVLPVLQDEPVMQDGRGSVQAPLPPQADALLVESGTSVDLQVGVSEFECATLAGRGGRAQRHRRAATQTQFVPVEEAAVVIVQPI